MVLNCTLSELCLLLSGNSQAPAELHLSRIASLEHAAESDLSVVFDPDSVAIFPALEREKIEKSKASLFLASKAWVDGKNYLIVADPLAAYQKLVATLRAKEAQKFEKNPTYADAFVSLTSSIGDQVTIEPSVYVGNKTTIGAQSSLGATAYIGNNCSLGKNVTIMPGARILDNTVIGDYSVIRPGAVIGGDGFGYKITKRGLQKIPHIGNVIIGAHVEIGANATIDRAVFESTVIEDGCKLDNSVDIAHNVRIGAHTAILAHTAVAGSSVVGRGCFIGAFVAIKDHITIGNGAKIVSKAGVMKSVADGATVAGFPAVDFMEWKKTSVLISKLPELVKKFSLIQNASPSSFIFSGVARCKQWFSGWM